MESALSAAQEASARRRGVPAPLRLLPGMLLALVVALAARFVAARTGVPAMILALLMAMPLSFLSQDERLKEGLTFSARTLLRLGVALLGLRITLDAILALGWQPVAIVAIAVPATILFGAGLARLLGCPIGFGVLTGGATAICGASAALAISAAQGRRDEDGGETLFTVLAVTSLSTVAMVAYPLLAGALGLKAREAGLLFGGSIHDVAQVVGAGYAYSEEAGIVATYTKLLRVACLALVVPVVCLLAARRGGAATGGLRLPWFLVAFFVLAAATSGGILPEGLVAPLVELSGWLLLVAIAALGFKTSVRSLLGLGPRAVALVLLETLFLLGLVTALVLA